MILPAADERDIVVFKLWPSLPYNTRLLAGAGLILVGLTLQGVTESFWSGLIFLAAANALLLVSGYDNRVDFGRYDPSAEWQRVDMEKLQELSRLDRKMRKWDLSALDVTNPLGAVVFVLLTGLLVSGAIFTRGGTQILLLDAMVLLLPHWITGIRRILTRPKLTIKIKMIESLLIGIRDHLGNHQVRILMLLTSGETPLPEDVKFRIDIDGRQPDFLGLYGQVVLNEVQGTSYPYFYVVLVARRGFGLEKAFSEYVPPPKITKEFKVQDEVEVFVIRQYTTKKSGYHTKLPAALRILGEGLSMAEKTAKGEVP